MLVQFRGCVIKNLLRLYWTINYIQNYAKGVMQVKFRSKYFYLTLIYIIIIGCGTILCMYPPNGITLFMICGDMCLVVCLLLPESRIIEISQEGCNVRLLFLKKRYRWEDIAFICYGEVKCSKSMSAGLFFSTKAVKKNGKKMTPYKVYHSLHFLECFYIIFEDKEQEEVLKCLNTWGVNYSVEESLLQRKSYERSLEEKIRMREERKRLYEDSKKRKR